MRSKVFALGNILMRDDAVAVKVAEQLEPKLHELGIELVYGETDIGYCMRKIRGNDFIIFLDAARLGKTPGEVTMIPLQDYYLESLLIDQHEFSFLDYIHLYLPETKGLILAIEVAEIYFCYGLSKVIMDRLDEISKQVLKLVIDFNQTDEDN